MKAARRLRHKKSCLGSRRGSDCKALEPNHITGWQCSFGFKTKTESSHNSQMYKLVPDDKRPCPKPLTNSDYIMWSRIYE